MIIKAIIVQILSIGNIEVKNMNLLIELILLLLGNHITLLIKSFIKDIHNIIKIEIIIIIEIMIIIKKEVKKKIGKGVEKMKEKKVKKKMMMNGLNLETIKIKDIIIIIIIILI